MPDAPTLDDLRARKWLHAGEALSGSSSFRWVRENIPPDSRWISVDTYMSMAACAAQSMGLAILPCVTADPIPQLRRLVCPWFEMNTPIWVLTHPQFRNVARIRAFMDYISNAIRKEGISLDGSGSDSSR